VLVCAKHAQPAPIFEPMWRNSAALRSPHRGGGLHPLERAPQSFAHQADWQNYYTCKLRLRFVTSQSRRHVSGNPMTTVSNLKLTAKNEQTSQRFSKSKRGATPPTSQRTVAPHLLLLLRTTTILRQQFISILLKTKNRNVFNRKKTYLHIA